jgi:hypothetical protein
VIVLNKRHLKRLMNEYVGYYHEDRTHLALAKGTPAGRQAEENSDESSRIVSIPRLGGLSHCFEYLASALMIDGWRVASGGNRNQFDTSFVAIRVH